MINSKSLSGMWKSANEIYFKQFLKDSIDNLTGKVIVSDKNGGRINISLYPDGKYIAFFPRKISLPLTFSC